MFIVIAGPAFNLLSAVVIIYCVYISGVPAMTAVIGEVQEDSPAAAADLRPGDTIIDVGGEEIEVWEDLTSIVHGSAGVELDFTVRRGEEELRFTIAPRESTSENIFGEEVSIGLVGITPSQEFTSIRYGPVESLGMSVGWTAGMIKLTLLAIVKMVQGNVPADNLGGPLLIAQMAGRSAEQGLLSLLYFISYVSVALGLFNLFPIPVLDGGHLLFFSIEAVRGKPLSLKKREILQQVGIVLLISLMLYATKNDIYRFLGW